METLDLARWQFAATTVYHFLFVPLTLGLAMLVAGMQTAWVRTDNPVYLRMTKFWGKLLSHQLRARRRHPHRAGVPVRHGLEWLLPLRRRHLRCATSHRGLVASSWSRRSSDSGCSAGSTCPRSSTSPQPGCSPSARGSSAFFILVANSWMQHPVAYKINEVTHRAELQSIWKCSRTTRPCSRSATRCWARWPPRLDHHRRLGVAPLPAPPPGRDRQGGRRTRRAGCR